MHFGSHSRYITCQPQANGKRHILYISADPLRMQWRRRVSTGCVFGSKSSEGVSDIALGLIAGRGTPGSPRSPGSLGSSSFFFFSLCFCFSCSLFLFLLLFLFLFLFLLCFLFLFLFLCLFLFLSFSSFPFAFVGGSGVGVSGVPEVSGIPISFFTVSFLSFTCVSLCPPSRWE